MTQQSVDAVDPQTAELARTRLQAARAHAISVLTPYFGTALSAMVMHEVPRLGTVATDTRWRFYYDPEVVATWSLGMCAAAWLHELKHNLHRHAERFASLNAPASNHAVFNIAGDALLNEDLRALAQIAVRGGHGQPVLELGADWVYLSSLPVRADRSMTTEQIYWLLLSAGERSCPVHGPHPHAEAAGGGGRCTCLEPRDCGSGAGSQHDRWWEFPKDDGSDGSVDAGRGDLIAYDTARQIAATARQSGRGSVPGGLLAWAEQMLDPVVDWRTQLRSLVASRCAAIAGRRDYSYQRPGRRHSLHGFILPSMREPPPPSGAVVLDTSGSMSPAELAQGLAEIAGILKQVSRGRSRLQVIMCDADAGEARTIRSISDVRLAGGGGTDMRVGIGAAAALRPRADFVVVFTDGLTPWPDHPPEHNPAARYIAVLSDGPRAGVPHWMRTIVVAGPHMGRRD